MTDLLKIGHGRVMRLGYGVHGLPLLVSLPTTAVNVLSPLWCMIRLLAAQGSGFSLQLDIAHGSICCLWEWERTESDEKHGSTV